MITILIGSLILGTTEPTAPMPSFTEKIEAKVGNEIITSTDLVLMIETIKTQNPHLDSDRLRQLAREAEIDVRLISQYLNKMNIGISDREVDQRINSIRTANNIQSEEQFKALLESQGTSFQRFKNQLKRQMEQMQFATFIRRQMTRTIEEKDLKTYYSNHAKRFSSTPEVELKECFIPYGENPELAKERAKEFEAKPKTFDRCVKTLSESPSAQNEGYLGKFQRNDSLREDIEMAVFSLNEGEVTVIQTGAGLQLFKVVKRRDLGSRSYDDVKAQIKDLLESDLAEKEMKKVLAELRASTFIQI